MMKNQQIMRVLLWAALLGCLSMPMTAKKLASFPGINMPLYFEVYGEQIYIGEDPTISIYRKGE